MRKTRREKVIAYKEIEVVYCDNCQCEIRVENGDTCYIKNGKDYCEKCVSNGAQNN